MSCPNCASSVGVINKLKAQIRRMRKKENRYGYKNPWDRLLKKKIVIRSHERDEAARPSAPAVPSTWEGLVTISANRTGHISLAVAEYMVSSDRLYQLIGVSLAGIPVWRGPIEHTVIQDEHVLLRTVIPEPTQGHLALYPRAHELWIYNGTSWDQVRLRRAR